jgi:hypothetical protein
VIALNAFIQALFAMVGGLLTLLGVILSQRMMTAREREARLAEQEAERLRAHNRFQAKSLMAAQKLAARLIERAVDVMSLRIRVEKADATHDENWAFLKEELRKVSDEARKIGNELALFRERIVNDELRAKLRVLYATVGKYRWQAVPEIKIAEAVEDMNAQFQEANDLLGELLRKLI